MTTQNYRFISSSTWYNLLITYIIIAIFTFCSTTLASSPDATLVEPIKVEYYEFYEQFTAIGKCKSENSKTYHAQISGTIDSINATQNDYVSAGDILITIDSDIAKAIKSKAEAAFKSAKSSYERDISLLKKKVLSTKLLDKSKVNMEIAQANLVTAQNQYEDMIITAPYDGYIGVINARIGDDVKPNDYLFSLIAKGDISLFVELPEILHSKVNNNSTIFTLDTNNKKTLGKIIAISDYINENGTITGKFLFPQDSNLIHGSYIESTIIFGNHKGLALPEKVIMKNNKGNFVYRINQDNKIEQIYINVGIRTKNMIEILPDDLQLGDLIVMNGLTKVYDGSTVEIIKNSEADSSNSSTDDISNTKE